MYTTLYIVYHPIYCIPPYILYTTLYICFDTDASFYIKQVEYIMNIRIIKKIAYFKETLAPMHTTLYIVYHPIYCMPFYM